MMDSTIRSSCSLALGTVDTGPRTAEVISHAKYMQAKEMSSRAGRLAGPLAPDRFERGRGVAVVRARQDQELHLPGSRQLEQAGGAAHQVGPHVGVPADAPLHQ